MSDQSAPIVDQGLLNLLLPVGGAALVKLFDWWRQYRQQAFSENTTLWDELRKDRALLAEENRELRESIGALLEKVAYLQAANEAMSRELTASKDLILTLTRKVEALEREIASLHTRITPTTEVP